MHIEQDRDAIKFKSFKFKLKQVQGDGIIRGYASTFGNVDQGRDVVVKGAFKKTLNENKNVPILDSHDPFKQIGINIEAEEDSKGLYVEGQINLEDPMARAKFSLVQMAQKLSAKSGLSIGYRILKDEWDRETDVRYLKELKLFEYSLVAFPMNEEATIVEAKSRNDRLDWTLKSLIESGYGPEHIKSALDKLAAEVRQDEPEYLLHSLDSIIKTIRGN